MTKEFKKAVILTLIAIITMVFAVKDALIAVNIKSSDQIKHNAAWRGLIYCVIGMICAFIALMLIDKYEKIKKNK